MISSLAKKVKEIDRHMGEPMGTFQALSGDFQHDCGKINMSILLSMQCCLMCIFLFLKFYDIIKAIVHIYIVFLKKVGPLILYLTQWLFQIFITCNRTDVSLCIQKLMSKLWKK